MESGLHMSPLALRRSMYAGSSEDQQQKIKLKPEWKCLASLPSLGQLWGTTELCAHKHTVPKLFIRAKAPFFTCQVSVSRDHSQVTHLHAEPLALPHVLILLVYC